MKKFTFLLLILIAGSCVEKLMEKPDDLIAKETMVNILTELAILNAAKSINIGMLREHDIDPTTFVFKKYGIDSLQFVASDRYYASIPLDYEEIYTEVEAILARKKDEIEATKKINDSLKLIERKTDKKPGSNKSRIKEIKDSLP